MQRTRTMLVAALAAVAMLAAACGASFDEDALAELEAWAGEAITAGERAAGDLAATVTGGEPVDEPSVHQGRLEQLTAERLDLADDATIASWGFNRTVGGETFQVDGEDLAERVAALELSLEDLLLDAERIGDIGTDGLEASDVSQLETTLAVFADARDGYLELMHPGRG